MRAAALALLLVLSGCVPRALHSTERGGGAVAPVSAADEEAGRSLFPAPLGRQAGFVDRGGGVAIVPAYDEVGPFSEGRARARQGGVWGYLAPDGTWAIPPRYLDASDFAQGRARVVLPDAPPHLHSRQGREADRRLVAFVGPSGEVVVSPELTQARDFVPAGGGALAPVARAQARRLVPLGIEALAFLAPTLQPREEWVALAEDGSVAFALPQASTVLSFSEGLAAFERRAGLLQPRGRWGYVDDRGEEVIAPRFERAGPFSEGLAPVVVDGRFGFADRSGEVVIEARFEEAGPFRDGRARVRLDRQWGYVDRDGALAIAPAYDAAFDFSEGLAVVGQGGRYGFVRPDGTLALPLDFSSARPFRNGLAFVRQGAREGYISPDGAFVWERE